MFSQLFRKAMRRMFLRTGKELNHDLYMSTIMFTSGIFYFRLEQYYKTKSNDIIMHVYYLYYGILCGVFCGAMYPIVVISSPLMLVSYLHLNHKNKQNELPEKLKKDKCLED